MQHLRIFLLMKACLALACSDVWAQETPIKSAFDRTNIGLHYNLLFHYSPADSFSYGFDSKPKSLIGIFTPSLSLRSRKSGHFHLIELNRLGINLPATTLPRSLIESIERDSVTGFVTVQYRHLRATFHPKLEIGLRYEYNLPFLRKKIKPESPIRCFMGLSLRLSYFEGVVDPHEGDPFHEDIRQYGFALSVHPHLQYAFGPHWLLDGGWLIPTFNGSLNKNISRDPTLTEAQRDAVTASLESFFVGMHLRLGAHYIF